MKIGDKVRFLSDRGICGTEIMQETVRYYDKYI